MPPGYNGMANPNMPFNGYQGQPGPNQYGVYSNLATLFNALPNGIYVKQKPDYLEQIVGWNRQNKYKVYSLDNTGQKSNKEIFYCKETSECCDRVCVSQQCRGIDMDIRREDTQEIVLRLSRECQCTCCCCNRPEMKVYLSEGGQHTYLGKVVDPYDCCNHSFRVYDESDNLKFVVEADCCQLGLICQCPCETCERVVFNIWRGEKERQEQPLMKLGTGDCCKNAITTADNFS